MRATPDQVTNQNAFMVLTRAKNQPGPDGIVGDRSATVCATPPSAADPDGTPNGCDESADDVQEATNTDTPLVDQSQTYTSHASHQAFLREYVASTNGRDGVAGNLDDGGPVATGKLVGDSNRPAGIHGDTGMATWASVKRQARTRLGINLTDPDLLDIPMLATSPYGEFIPGPHGLPQLVRTGPDGKVNTADDTLLEGTLPTPVNVPADVAHFDTPFVGDIAHNADPSPRHNPDGSTTIPTADTDTVVNDPQRPLADPDTYDDELLDTHFCAGDGRVNENIALTTIHQVFHSEHDRLVGAFKTTLAADTSPEGVADLNAFWKPTNPTPAGGPNVAVDANGWAGDRLFQAARFVTEMEYQHLVFEEFARKVQPAVRPFHIYHSDLNPVIPAEFAHAVYRFGHSMLDDDVARVTEDANGVKTDHSLPLLTAFLNPPEYFNSGNPAQPFTPEQAAGAIVMGSSDQDGNELDEFVTETLRNNLLGLPLDLPTINMTRAREAGVPSLNNLRRLIHNQTNDGQLAPYTDWSDYGQHLKHPESLVNYVAAYGEHPTIRDSGPDGDISTTGDNVLTVAAKRAAARAIVDPLPTDTQPADAADFMFSTGTWDGRETGLNNVDLWVGGLGEVTNLFGGLLGSTFNYVFQNTLENLQDGDRLYYLNRTPGMNLRTQLEGNSFGEMIERNTDGTHTLKADVFATADCKFELGHITFPFSGTPSTPPDPPSILGAGSVNDDPNTDCDENQLILRKPDGTFQYRSRNNLDPSGINGQAVYNGTAVVDRVFGGNDNDTIWGNEGNDILEGNGGDDDILGGDGNDIITDLDGADILKGGDGNDAVDGGPGDDIIMSGSGQDFTNGGSFDNETFGGPQNDFINLGQGADAGFGDGGDDWMQGGSGQDLIQGDHSAPFFDDPAESHPGNEIMVGQVGENDYDAEGGDDLMSQNSAVDRNAGAGGWDWAFHQYDTVGADDDMEINNNLLNLPIQVVVNRDRWQETEADSGSPFNDLIKGDDAVPTAVGGAGFTGCDALDQAGLDRIPGLDPLVPPLTVPAATVAVNSASGVCPLTGNVWGDGNILLGGGGGDTIEGRAGNDIIDGDKALHVRIAVLSGPGGTELGSTDLMEGKALTGTFGTGTTGMTLQEAVFKGVVDPGNLEMRRRIDTEAITPGTIDTAVFSGARANYAITQAAGVVTVTDNVGTDGTDTLTGIENLRFTDGDVSIAPLATLTANVSPANFGSQQIGTTGTARTFTLTNSGLNPLSFTAATRFTLGGTDAASFSIGTTTCTTSLAPGASCTVQVSFRPVAPAGPKAANLVATNNSGNIANSTESVALTGTATAAPPQTAPTGTPALTLSPLPNTITVGTTLTATRGSLADANGITSVAFQWQQTAPNGTTFALIPGTGNQTSFQIPLLPILNNPNRCRSFRVVATITDGLGKVETGIASPATARVPPAAGQTCTAPPALAATAAPAAPVTPLGAATAPRLAPTPLSAGSVTVTSSSSAPLAVSATVPAGANTVAISLFRLNSVIKRTSKARQKPSSVHVATVYRKAPKAKRYVFRLTEKPFRHLKPGRYLVQVRVGASRTALGPAASRQITIRKARSNSAR